MDDDSWLEEELAKIRAEISIPVTQYMTECYAEFHDISEGEAYAILNGCGALDGYYEYDWMPIGHMNMCNLISMLRHKVERLGGTNPPAILPKQMGYETVTELLPY